VAECHGIPNIAISPYPIPYTLPANFLSRFRKALPRLYETLSTCDRGSDAATDERKQSRCQQHGARATWGDVDVSQSWCMPLAPLRVVAHFLLARGPTPSTGCGRCSTFVGGPPGASPCWVRPRFRGSRRPNRPPPLSCTASRSVSFRAQVRLQRCARSLLAHAQSPSTIHRPVPPPPSPPPRVSCVFTRDGCSHCTCRMSPVPCLHRHARLLVQGTGHHLSPQLAFGVVQDGNAPHPPPTAPQL